MAGCRTIILHKDSGQTIEEEYLLPVSAQRDPLMSFGATVSYVRRYTYPFFVPDDEHDHPEQGGGQAPQDRPSGPRGDQGSRKSKPSDPISEKQLGRLMAKIRSRAAGDDALMQTIAEQAKNAVGFPQESSVKALPRGIYEGFCNFVDEWQPEDEPPVEPEDESQDPADQAPSASDPPTQDEVDAAFYGSEEPF